MSITVKNCHTWQVTERIATPVNNRQELPGNNRQELPHLAITVKSCHLPGMEAVMPFLSGFMTPAKARTLLRERTTRELFTCVQRRQPLTNTNSRRETVLMSEYCQPFRIGQ